MFRPDQPPKRRLMPDRVQGLARVLALMVGTTGMAHEMMPKDAMAQSPTEQGEYNPQQAQRAFEQLQRSYQKFDENNLAATVDTLQLYQSNLELAQALPASERAEYERQFAYLNYQSVVLQYDSTQPNLQPKQVSKRAMFHEADQAVLGLSLKLLDQAQLDHKLATIDSTADMDASVTFQTKVEQLRQDIQTTLDCIVGASPEAVAAKQAMFKQIESILKAKGYDATVTAGDFASGSVFLQFMIRLPEHRMVAFGATLRYDKTNQQSHYISSGESYGRPYDAAIMAGLAAGQ